MSSGIVRASGTRAGAEELGKGPLRVREARRLPAEERERQTRALALRLDRPLSVLGVIFLLVVLADGLATDPRLRTWLSVAGWVLWAVFAGEFAVRLYLAPHRGRFLRRNWWQLVFLVVPFLRFLRLFWVLRTARVGRLWLAATTTVLVLAVSQWLYVSGDYPSYGPALYDTALATITGEPLSVQTGTAQTLSVLLAGYSVAVVATLAAALGAWFVSPEPDAPGDRDAPRASEA